MRQKVCRETIRRLPIYLACLREIEATRGKGQIVSSEKLAALAGVKPTQLRKDLAYFGEFGRRGLGYDASDLAHEIKRILKLDRIVPMILIGMGSLGTAFARFISTRASLEKDYPFRIKAIFDKDPRKTNSEFMGIKVYHIDELRHLIHELNPTIAVVAVPSQVSEPVMAFLCECGVKAVLNFAAPPTKIKPTETIIHNVDLGAELEFLSYYS
ncbi:MAG: redox-sensing transcriptional repressor Rex [Bacillota bacterium]|jgi:redox-sensing transcriptional repressor|nr:redox-sensing transcriptional repressor Rex [Bacillota bacterium]HOB90620.1 redox-sensing transcriptional repressor Rex [Bacillota bacterium]HPZ53534.1 redox-sensing transcriptional repressor Rex [Bacillota bacterium]HQD17095.1 redox-sensing transcriptional repressor Rex [Bacillota bacterium]